MKQPAIYIKCDKKTIETVNRMSKLSGLDRSKYLRELIAYGAKNNVTFKMIPA